MAVATGNQYIWGFVHWAERNPYSGLNSVHWDKIKQMLAIFSRVNTTDGSTATETDPESYSADLDIPGKTTDNDDTNGISFTTPTDALCRQSRYPESHIFTAAGT
jgi:hypothetical protein